MKCRYCQFENPSGVKFCGQCGTRLEVVCPSCKGSNPPEFKFCGQCGHDLTSPAGTAPPHNLAFEEKLAKLQKYLPTGLAEKILSQRGKIEGERRHVTIMFVDMEGFTPLTERLGPEETFSLMDQVFEILIHKIHDYEGTVHELRGDGVLALFGSPIALEDAPQRAIRSALAIHHEMTKFSERIKNGSRIPSILLRIGINSGPVVLGTMGNDLRVQFTAVGDTINMAARMQQLAEPGTTYVTEDTFKLTEGFFHFEALGEKTIKGKEKPARVYQVIAPSTRRTRFDVSAERGLSRFIGRERELAVLLDSFERAQAGRGQAVSIMGEAGVGKSRLLYEFRKALPNEDILFLEGKCLSYGQGVAYHPITDVLKSSFGVEDGDTAESVTVKVRKELKMLGIEEVSTLPYLLELLSVKHSGINSILMSPQAMKDRICAALQSIILKGSETRPLIFAFEDLHWMDKSSEEAVKYLLDCVPKARILMIFTYRPEFVHTWLEKFFHSQITLNRLCNGDCVAMIANLLGSDYISSDLQDLILERTEGVPFFIEEFVRSLGDMRIIERRNHGCHLGKDIGRVTIPSTIQDVIMARVDTLPDAAKEVLQFGSAIEREFRYELIEAITDFPERELLSHLSALKEANLLHERGIFPQSTYTFKHAITRQVVYDSILTNRKKLLHQAIGKAVEDLYRDSLDAHCGVLADHFMMSEDFQKSADYSKLTYERARTQAAFPSAVSYALKRIAALENLTPTESVDLQLIDARTFLGLTLYVAGDLAGAKEAIEPIVEVVLKSNEKRWLAQIEHILGTYQYSVEEDFPSAFELLQKAIQNIEETSYLTLAAPAYLSYGLARCWDCQFEMGAESIRKALRIGEAAHILWGVSVLSSNLSYYAYNYQGKVDEGFGTSLKAVETADKSGDIYSRAVGYSFHGISCYYKGFMAASEEYLLKGVALCERIQSDTFSAIAHQALGYVYFETADYCKSEIHHQQAILIRERSGLVRSCANMNKIALARVACVATGTDLDLASLEQLLRSNRVKMYYGIMARHLGEIFFHAGTAHFEEAESWLQAGILHHEQHGMRWDLARDYLVLARFRKLQGRALEEKNYLAKSLALFNECGAEGWCRRIEEGKAER